MKNELTDDASPDYPDADGAANSQCPRQAPINGTHPDKIELPPLKVLRAKATWHHYAVLLVPGLGPFVTGQRRLGLTLAATTALAFLVLPWVSAFALSAALQLLCLASAIPPES